jgi:hypothetical protein
MFENEIHPGNGISPEKEGSTGTIGGIAIVKKDDGSTFRLGVTNFHLVKDQISWYAFQILYLEPQLTLTCRGIGKGSRKFGPSPRRRFPPSFQNRLSFK